MNMTIEIDLDKPCKECGKKGATQAGICMKCVLKAVQGKPMLSDAGRAVQARFDRKLEANR